MNYTNTSIYSENFATPTWLLSSDTYFFQSILNANENDTPFLCSSIVITGINGTNSSYSTMFFSPQSVQITPTSRVIGTDISVTTASSGNPLITKLTSVTTTNNEYYVNRICIYESFRRLFPVIRDKNTIVLTDGTNTSTLTSTSGYPISKASDVTITTPANGKLLIYNSTSSKWVNTDVISDNILFIKDDVDGTKKFQFQLSSITANQTRILTIPNASTTIVGTDVSQTLTNKTLDDTTNTITCDKIRTATGTVTISSATAPSSGQVLTASSSTSASWQTMTAPTQSYLKFNKILFINTSSYVSSEYTILGQQDYITETF